MLGRVGREHLSGFDKRDHHFLDPRKLHLANVPVHCH
jgi:hypothetical protein